VGPQRKLNMDWTSIEERAAGDLVILDVRGSVAMCESPGRLFHRVLQLVEQERSRILINMTEVPFIDSQGLGDIVQGFKIASANGGSLKLYGACDRIREVLNLTRLVAVIETLDSERQGVDAFHASAANPPPGAFLAEHPAIPGYEPERLIARNGAIVYAARRVSTGEPVVLKVYDAASAHVRARDSVLARLDHPNILRVAEMGEIDGRSYAALEHVGRTLADRLREGALPPLQAARACQAIAGALEYARRQQLVHLNLTPPSILLDADGKPKLFDFEAAGRGRNVHGSVARRGFSTPEELRGGDAATVAADVYRVGAAMYAMLTGRPPFTGEWIEIVRSVTERPPSNPQDLNPGVPGHLQTACLRCLEKQPEQRYSSLGALADDLEQPRKTLPAT
jgi:anti-anti-sigma factor